MLVDMIMMNMTIAMFMCVEHDYRHSMMTYGYDEQAIVINML